MLKSLSKIRASVLEFTEHPRFRNSIMVLLVINAITLGLETSRSLSADVHQLLIFIDMFILMLLVGEVCLRWFAHGMAYFRDPWNMFDFGVTAIALIPSAGPFAVLRAFRILRILRILTVMPRFRRVITAIAASIPGISSIVVVMMVIYYVFAVMATNLFHAQFPDLFGDIGRSMFTLFQVMTLESWASQIARPVMTEHPYAWLYFITFILCTTFVMLNLVIVVLINSMNEATSPRKRRAGDPEDFDPAKLRKRKF